VVPAGHVARIGGVEMTGTGEPAQHAIAHLLHAGEILWRQRGRLGELDLSLLALGEHPVDHAAVEVDMRIQRAAKVGHERERPHGGSAQPGGELHWHCDRGRDSFRIQQREALRQPG
jgi:hypothetical protein